VFVPETVVVVCVTQATAAIVGGQVFEPVTTVVLELDDSPDFVPDDFDPFVPVPDCPATRTGGPVSAAIPEYNAKTIVRRSIRETADFPNFSFIRWIPVEFGLFGLVVFQTWGALNW
jgi:hypothetical protein